MGYDLHITRAGSWFESEEAPISSEEWLALVENDDSLTHAPAEGAPFFCEWRGTCVHGEGTWFDWSEGHIYTTGPDSPIIAKMLEIASAFDATVQGDDAEVYEDDSGVPVGYTPPEPQEESTNKPWWKFW